MGQHGTYCTRGNTSVERRGVCHGNPIDGSQHVSYFVQASDPNSMGPILVTLTFSIPNAIFTEAFLSFLGLGVQDPQASWGTLTKEGIDAMQYYPWMVLFPAVFISLAMLAFNVLGDGLRDALDPRMRS